MQHPLWLFVYGGVLLALVTFVLGASNLRARRRRGGLLNLLVSLFLLASSALALAVALGMHGYLALTREVTACTVEVTRLAPQTYDARVRFPDGDVRTFMVRGDELYLDARILKWHAAANLLGLHTAYRLDRIAGRYTSLDDEQTQPRTVFALSDDPPVDLFGAARRLPFLQPLVDASYGSGTFVPLGDGGTFVVRVSTTGLLVRSADASPAAVPASTR